MLSTVSLDAGTKIGGLAGFINKANSAKSSSKPIIYKMKKHKGKTQLSVKPSDLNQINEEPTEIGKHKDSGAVHVEKKTTPKNMKPLPPWKGGGTSPSKKSKPPKPPLKIPIPKKKKQKPTLQNPKACKASKSEPDPPPKNEEVSAKQKANEFLKQMRMKRVGRRAYSQSGARVKADASFMHYYDWDKELGNETLPSPAKLQNIVIKANELEDKAKMKEKVFEIHDKTKAARIDDPLRINDMLVHSIKAKIKVLDKLNQ